MVSRKKVINKKKQNFNKNGSMDMKTKYGHNIMVTLKLKHDKLQMCSSKKDPNYFTKPYVKNLAYILLWCV